MGCVPLQNFVTNRGGARRRIDKPRRIRNQFDPALSRFDESDQRSVNRSLAGCDNVQLSRTATERSGHSPLIDRRLCRIVLAADGFAGNDVARCAAEGVLTRQCPLCGLRHVHHRVGGYGDVRSSRDHLSIRGKGRRSAATAVQAAEGISDHDQRCRDRREDGGRPDQAEPARQYDRHRRRVGQLLGTPDRRHLPQSHPGRCARRSFGRARRRPVGLRHR